MSYNDSEYEFQEVLNYSDAEIEISVLTGGRRVYVDVPQGYGAPHGVFFGLSPADARELSAVLVAAERVARRNSMRKTEA